MSKQLPESYIPEMPDLTDEQAQAIARYVGEQGEARLIEQGRKFNEVDFIAGAMSVLFALGLADRIPPAWVIFPMSGRHLFGPKKGQ